VSLVLKVLSQRTAQVDVVTYHEGRDLHYEYVTVHRIPNMPFIRGVRPGFSWKKVICDVLMLGKALRLVSRNKYHLVHAVEESVYIAVLLKFLFRIPYVYDMDSSLPQQLMERYPWLAGVKSLLNSFERLAVRNAKVVVPVCEALSDSIREYHPPKVMVVHDVALPQDGCGPAPSNLKSQLGVEGLIIMYVGNLERYQGIDLLVDSFALALKRTVQADMVIIGGDNTDIERYRKRASDCGLDGKIHFLGPKPVQDLSGYLSQADILVSPRTRGNNTPMKIYSYLQSGKAVLATELPTHTQVLSPHVAMLAPPDVEMFSKAMVRLIEDEALRVKLGKAGKEFVETRYTYSSLREKLMSLFDYLEREIVPGPIVTQNI
jgi:glycosyltransferase involved in cell wall biosynthesis